MCRLRSTEQSGRTPQLTTLRCVAVLALAVLGSCTSLGFYERPSVKIVLVGDSTVAEGSGWGPAFCARHVKAHVVCVDLAKSGRSSASYRAEGSWSEALSEIGAGVPAGRTYVLVQFGHNDQPGKPGRSTDLATGFGPNMQRFAVEVAQRGAHPILVTPLSRRSFQNGKVVEDLAPWADATRKAAAAASAPVLDLNADSVRALNEMGAPASLKFAMAPAPAGIASAAATGTTAPAPKTGPAPVFDYTHLGSQGSEFFAEIVAREILTSVPALRRDVLP